MILPALCALSLPLTAHAQTTVTGVNVPGSSNPFLAGMPPGSGADGDSAPDQSPVQVLGLNLPAGGDITFSVTGSVDFGGGGPTDPPDGSFNVGHGAENGLGGYQAPANSLVGVFLDASEPDLSPAPADLDFTSGAGIGTAFTTLAPGLKQIFFIGDGLTGTGSGAAQQFTVPFGAQRLFLGSVDGTGWFNNSGNFTVSVTQSAVSATAPEPGSIALMLTGASALTAVIARRRRRA